ncbi:hypothetical protein AB0D49_08500 [Streptomyces sp. NPDC048290]|uniref:hypothetical protein n=1 Tax=Streptomyces sp. NPDC048290 TaxID=3155811 RepID=UPI003446B9A9
MTGPEHYREAQSLLDSCKTSDGAVVIEDGNEQLLAAAQVHATLALAAATALIDTTRAAPRSDMQDRAAWRRVAGVPVPEDDD